MDTPLAPTSTYARKLYPSHRTDGFLHSTSNWDSNPDWFVCIRKLTIGLRHAQVLCRGIWQDCTRIPPLYSEARHPGMPVSQPGTPGNCSFSCCLHRKAKGIAADHAPTPIYLNYQRVIPGQLIYQFHYMVLQYIHVTCSIYCWEIPLAHEHRTSQQPC